ncbi:hypothetical protein HXX76_009311 [Chlamydomonas incerta]|uniref:Trafficking protein particle complex subunit 11 domain-containing protein n=1 Tax=Chlamydomonas incerta TaxID=51695 RepID=A0A835VWD1_CHLIN|nr:hypothetical protein HXX76_009311 [Chlamydomonas incerta]|eukprot:KAG2431817.1 hypothetical protein HXX76_009311 [Chlamydomonas incerta]
MAACNFVASFYPQEHRTPPLPLVALLGCPELHREIGDFFIQQHRPPLVFHGSNEPIEQFVSRAFGPKKQLVLLGPVLGILKSDWFAKHRGKKPAMAVALVERRDLEGDPSTWNRLVYGLKLVADGAGQRGAGLIVGVVQQQGLGDLPPDRVQAVAHNLSLDRRLILPLPLLPPPGTPADDPAVKHVRDASLGRLGKLVLELCTAYYSRLSRHVADKAAQRRAALNGPLPPELAARTAFKLAVYAEFRQDWATAVAHYREAYAGCLAVQVLAGPAQGPPAGPGPAGGSAAVKPQKWTEVCAVAELVHLKLLMLAVHQGRVEEAVAQVRAHLGHFRSPPGSLPAPAASSHLGYLVRQHQVAAQEVGSHVDALPAYLPATFTSSALGLGAQQATSVALGPGAGPTGGGAGGGGWAGGAPGGGGPPPPGLPAPHPPHSHHASAPAGYPQPGQSLLTGGGAAGGPGGGGGGGAAAGPTGVGSSFTGASAGSITGGAVVVPSSSLKDCSRPHLLMAAARLAVARRQAADVMRSARGMAVGGGGGGASGGAVGGGGGAGGGGGGPLLDTAPVRRGAFVGQLVLRNDAVQGGYSPLSDSDYCLFLESEECRLVTPALAIDVMNSALLLLKDCTGADRLRSQLGGLMAGEHMLAGNLSAARKLLLQVCHQYRREGWLLPLLQALVSLREVAQRLRLPSEHLCYSLEICALATQLQPPPQAAAAAAAAAAAQPPAAGAAAPHPITLLTQGGGGAGAGGMVSTAVTETASAAARIVDPSAAMVACRAAVSTLISGISEIKQGIMKSGGPSAPSSGAATPPEPVTPDSSASQLPLPRLSSAAVAAAAGAGAGGAGAGAAAGMPPGPPGTAAPPPTVTSGGLPRHFHYTVEHLDLREAQRRAREAGDPRPVADIMHRHSQHDYGWCRCIALAAGFAYGRPAGDADAADFYLGLYNQLPLALPLKGVVLHFADDAGDTWVQALPGPIPPDEPPAMPLPGHVGAALDSATHSFHHLHLNTHLRPHNARQQKQQAAAGPGGMTGPVEGDGTERLPGQLHLTDGPPTTSTATSSTSATTSSSATLPPHRWAHYSVRLAPRCLGRLRAERAILLLSDHATIVFKLASFPPATAAAAQPGVLTGPLLAPPTAAGRQARAPSLSAAAAVACGLPSVDHAAAPFRSIRAPGPVAGPAVAPGQLVFQVAHLGPLPSLTYGLPTGLALLGEAAPLLAVLAVPTGGRPLVGAAMEFVIGRTSGGLQPADIVLVVDDTEGPTKGLMALNNERYRIPLPPVQPGRRHTVRLWARSAAAGTAAVAAMLLCPAQVTASATLTFEEPFEFKCRLSSEVGVHTLSLPRVNARELGATQLTIGQPVVVTALVRALQPAMLELAGAQVALEPGAAIKLVADPAQQLAVLNGGVGGFDRGPAAAAAGGGSGIPGSAPGTAPPSPLRLQNGAAGAGDAGGGGGGGPLVVAPSRLCRGDVFTLLLPICPTEMLEHARSMGRLNLRWRRAAGHGLRAAMPAPPPPPPPAPAASGGRHGGKAAAAAAAAAAATAAAAAAASEGHGQQVWGDGDPDEVDPLAEPCPDPWVTTTLELPRVTVADSLLTARTVLGQTAVTAGIPFTYSLQLQNFGNSPLELMVSLTDSAAFACAGERSPSLTVPPRERASVSWQLTAPAPGHQALPAVRLLAPRHNCALTTQSPHVYVAPF